MLIRVELLPGFKFTGKMVKKWNLPVKLEKPVNGNGGKMLKTIFFSQLPFLDYTLAVTNKHSWYVLCDIYEVSFI